MIKLLLLSLFIAFFVSCGETKVAGGVSEETNTVAGLLENTNGPVRGVTVLARSISKDFHVSSETDSLGKFKMELPHGLYALTASESGESYYELVRVAGEDLNVSGQLLSSFDAKIQVLFADSSVAVGVKIALPGTNVKTIVGENGFVELENLPRGNYVVELSSEKIATYENVYYRVMDSLFVGPFPENIALDSLSMLDVSRSGYSADSVWILPWNTEKFLSAYWNFDRLDSSTRISALNLREKELPIYLYGNVGLVSGVINSALAFRDSTAFAVLESDSGIFNQVSEFSLEAWLRIDELPVENSFQKNMIGKVGFGGKSDSSVFSVALIRGVCGKTEPTVSFFVAEGNGMNFECENAVFDSSTIEVGEWQHWIMSFDQGVLRLFRNGIEISSVKSSVLKIDLSKESIYLGKETLIFSMDALRIHQSAVHAADAFLRYYKHGGR